MWTVWEFKSVDGKQTVRVIRPAEVDDRKFEHEYQKIVYRGDDHKTARSYT